MELGEKLKNHRIKKVCRRNVIPDAVLVFIRFVLLLSSTIWMAFHLRYEKDPEQCRKNTKIELAYGHGSAHRRPVCVFQPFYILRIRAASRHLHRLCLMDQPQYMNRTFVKKKTDD